MGQKLNYTLLIDADISQTQKAINQISSSLEKTKSDLSANITQSVGSIGERYTKLIKATQNPIQSLSQFDKIHAEIKSIDKDASHLQDTLDNLSKPDNKNKLQLLPESEIKKLNQVDEIFKKLTADTQKWTETTNKISSKKSVLDDYNKKLETARKSVETLEAAQKKIKEENTVKLNKSDNRDFARQLINKYQFPISGNGSGREMLAELKDLLGARNTPEYAADLYKQFGNITGQVWRGKWKNDYAEQMTRDYTEITQRLEAYEQAEKGISENEAYKTKTEEIKKAKEEVSRLETAAKNLDKSIAEQETKLAEFDSNWKNTMTTLSGLGVNTDSIKTGDIEALQKAISVLQGSELEKAQGIIDELKNKVTELLGPIAQTSEEIEKNQAAVKAWDDRMRDVSAIQTRLQYFFSTYNAINLLRRGVNSAISTIKELDEAMTKIAVVTDYSVGDMWGKLPEYTKNANALGVSVSEMYNAAGLYYEQGLKTNEVMELSVETMKMARIAGLDAADATDRITNALRAFNMELTEDSAQRVNDVYSKIASISASNVDELSTAMTKVASLASNVGMDFEQTTAYLATGIETTRESADSVGTALKTVLARFAEMKKDPSLQEAVDGETVDVNKVETALRTVGIALRDEQGQIRDMGDVFEELNKKWDTLDTNTQRYIATQAAGSRQQSRFIAILSNYARTQELYGAAINSAGAAEQQFEKTLDSLQTKLQDLKNAWNEFLMTITNSDVAKTAVDGLTKILELVNKALDIFDNKIAKSTVALGVLLGAFTAGKSIIFTYASAMGKVRESLKAGEALSFSQALKETVLVGKTGSSVFGTLAKNVGLATLKLAAISVILVLLTEAIKQITQIAHDSSAEGQLENVRNALADINSELKETNQQVSTLANLKDTLNDYSSEFANLTRNTTEWNNKLLENNNEILELASTYKELEVTIGEYGQLTFTDSSIVAAQNAVQNKLMLQQMSQAILSQQEARKSYEFTYSTNRNKLGMSDAKLNMLLQEPTSDIKELTQEEITLLEEIQEEETAYNNAQLNASRQIANAFLSEIDTSKYTNEQLNLLTTLLAQQINPELAKGQQELALLYNSNDEAFASALGGITGAALGLGAGIGINTIVAGILTAANPLLGLGIVGAGILGGGLLGSNLATNQSNKLELNDLLELNSEEGLGLHISQEKDGKFTINGTTYDYDSNAAAVVESKLQEQQLKKFEENYRGFVTSLNDTQAENFDKLLRSEANDWAGIAIDEGSLDVLSKAGIDLAKTEKELGLTTGALIKSFKESIIAEQKRREEIKKSNIYTAAQTNVSNVTAEWILGLDAKSQDILSSATETAAAQGPEALQSLYNVLTNRDLADDSTKELLNWLNETSFTNPIQAFSELNLQIEQGSGLIAEFSEEFLNLNNSQFSKSSQLNYLLNASNYEDLNKELDKFYKKQHKITSEKVSDLAQSYEDLGVFMENCNLNASKMASIFTTIQKTETDISALSDRYFKLRGEISSVADMTQEMISQIAEFEEPDSSRSGIEWLEETFDEIDKIIKDRAYGDSALQKYMESIFSDVSTRLSEATTTEAIENMYKEYDNALKRMKIGSGYGFWQDYANNGSQKISGLTAKMLNNGDIEFELTKGITYDALLQSVKQAYGLTDEAANYVLQGLTSQNSLLKRQLDNNGYADNLSSLIVDSIEGNASINIPELQDLANTWNKTLEQVVQDTTGAYGKIGQDVKFYDFSEMTADNMDDYISGSLTKTYGSTEITLDNLSDLMGGEYDYNELYNILASRGVNSNLIDQVINSLDTKLSESYTTYTKNEDGTLKIESVTLEADTVEGLREQEAEEDLKNQQSIYTSSIDNSTLVQGIYDELYGIHHDDDKPGYDSRLDDPINNLPGGTTGQDIAIENREYAKTGGLATQDEDALVDGNYQDETGAREDQEWRKTQEETQRQVEANGVAIEDNTSSEKVLTKAVRTLTNVTNKGITANPITETQKLAHTSTSMIFTSQDVYDMNKSKINNYLLGEENNGNISISTYGPEDKTDDGGATQSADYVERQYDWLYNLQQKINTQQKERNLLQLQYNNLLKIATDETEVLSDSMLAQSEILQNDIDNQTAFYKGRQQQYSQLLESAKNWTIRGITNADGTQYNGNGIGQFDLTQYAKINNGQVEIDYDKIAVAVSDINIGSELSSAIDEYIGYLEQINEDMYSSLEQIENDVSEIAEMRDSGRSTFVSITDRIAEALLNIEQKTIDDLSEEFESINAINEEIVEAVSENVNAIREQMDNEEEQQDLTKLQRRIAYLQQDTTGANRAEILKLQEQLTDDTESYRRTLVDQAIDTITAMNDAAAEQRQQQIDLLQSQVDWNNEHGTYQDKAVDILTACFNSDNSLNTNNVEAMKEVLSKGENWDGFAESKVGSTTFDIETELANIASWAGANDSSVSSMASYLSSSDSYRELISQDLDTIINSLDTSYSTDANGNKYKEATTKTLTSDENKSKEDGWVQDTSTNKWWYKTNDQYYANGWKNISDEYGDNWYYFDENGWMLANTTTPDGYYVGENGAWNGKYQSSKSSYTEAKIKSLDRNGEYYDSSLKDTEGMEDDWYRLKGNKYYYDGWKKINGVWYHFDEDGWIDDTSNSTPRYKTGGLVTSTGLAWLDGTASSPELVLNSADTKNFIELKNVLSDVLDKNKYNSQATSSSYMFDVDINVEELSDDYDVSKLAEKVQDEITSAMNYRNVTTIGIRK